MHKHKHMLRQVQTQKHTHKCGYSLGIFIKHIHMSNINPGPGDPAVCTFCLSLLTDTLNLWSSQLMSWWSESGVLNKGETPKTGIELCFSILELTWYQSTSAFDIPKANWPLKLLCLGLSSRSGLTLSSENSFCQSPFTHWSPIVENERFISLLSEDTCYTCTKYKNT